MRPEYTTPMIRAAISNGLLNNLPAKFFGTGQMFRRERPQKGRYRQFNQINFENFGTDDFFADIDNEDILCFFNFRSPYAYVGIKKALKLDLKLKFIPFCYVPKEILEAVTLNNPYKRDYLMEDCKRLFDELDTPLVKIYQCGQY